MKKIVLLLAFMMIELIPAQILTQYPGSGDYDDDSYYEGKTFNIHLFAGAGYGNYRFYLENKEGEIIRETIYPYTIGKLIGAKIEYNFPYNEGKWTLSFEPGLQFYKIDSDQVEEDGKRLINGEFSYQAFEIPILIRRYYNIDKKSKIFLNGGVALAFPFKSSYYNVKYGVHQKITYGFNFAGGIGYMYDKFGLEARFNLNRNLTLNETQLSAFKNISVIVSYRVF